MPISIAKCATTKRMAAVIPVRSITEDEMECDGAESFTENPAENQRQKKHCGKNECDVSNFFRHRIERVSIPRSLKDGRVGCARDNSATSHARLIRYDVGVNRSALK
jgi:hypothetical protein